MPGSKNPLDVDFDPLGDDDFGTPKPQTKVINKPAPDFSSFDGGMGGDDFGTPKPKIKIDATEKPKSSANSFWADAANAAPKPAAKPREDLGMELSGVSGVGAPTKNAFQRKTKDSVKVNTEDSERSRIRKMAEDVFGDEGKDAPNIPLDTAVSNGYWGAVFAYTCMNDLEVVVDAPVGCYSLPATATINYTDALPELPNLASSNITEVEVTLDGTTSKVLNVVKRVTAREDELQHHKQVVVVSSQESELIGADHVMSLQRKYPEAMYFTTHSFEDNEWQSRDTSLIWLYQERKRRLAVKAGLHIANDELGGPKPALKSTLVNIIGPTYSCFNSYADLHEVKRLIRGVGGEIHFVFPFEATYREMDKLDESSVNVCLYREFGEGLAKLLGKPYLFAPFGMQETTDFLLELGRALGTEAQAKAFIAQEKRETLLPIWDIWLGAPQDFYSTTKIAIVANESYALGLKRFLGEELGLQIGTVINRQKSNDTNNYMMRNRLISERPTIMMGSMNERIYLAEASLPTKFMAAALPVPLICRSVGTPYMGYQGAVYLMQTITNILFDVLFDVLPRDKRTGPAVAKAAGGGVAVKAPADGPPSAATSGTLAAKPSAQLDGLSGGMAWSEDAKKIFDQLIEKVPWVARISAADKLRSTAIAESRALDLPEVTAQMVMKAVPSVMM